MKVCVVGAGAIGSFIGARLSLRSCQVAALARGATAASLRAHGFRLEQAGALVTAPVRVVEGRNAVTRKLGAFQTSMLRGAEAGRPPRRDPPLAAGAGIRR